MGLTALAKLATKAPAPVFVARGANAISLAFELRGKGDVVLTQTPRHACVLLATGAFPDSMVPALRQIHDQMSHPRGVVLVGANFPGHGPREVFSDPVVVAPQGDVLDAVVQLHRDLILGRRTSAPPLLPDRDPVPWRGVGPYGQGGKGMTGGTPYGRPLAGLADDRDGLKLDGLELRLGPFLPIFPPGLTLTIKLQGDVVQDASVGDNPFRTDERDDDARPSVFIRALSEPVTIRELEHARAAHHLERAGDALRAAGLGALGERADRLAANIERVEAPAVRRLHRLLRRSRTLAWATSGVGRLVPDRVAGRGLGLVARACGLPEDLRTQDRAYSEVGFSPLVEGGGDACARWRLRLAEAAQSLLLARAAGARTTGGTGSVESPWGSISSVHAPVASLVEMLPGLLEGSDWGDVITTIVSLDLDLEEAART